VISGRAVLLLGLPCSGKGTQAALLSTRWAVPHVSLGDILRRLVSREGDLGRRVQPFVARGAPLPVTLMAEVLRHRLRDPDVKSGLVGDGLVRTLDQARELDTMLSEVGIALEVVFWLDIPMEEVLRRTRSRLWCRVCGASYSGKSDPLSQSSICPVDAEPLFRRHDDSNDLVERRCHSHMQSQPAIAECYGTRGILRTVDGTQAVQTVHQDILLACANRGLLDTSEADRHTL
jgi:adenylate kinase